MEPLYSVITRGGSAAAIMQLRDRRQVEKLGFADLVTIFCLHECTDDRDLAFGLLGLLDTSHVSMKADYSLSPLRIVFETYMAIFLEVGPRKRELGFRSLLPFSRAVTRHHEGKDPPTWMQYGLYRVLYNLAKDGHLTIDQLTDFLESSDAREVEFSQEIYSWFEQGSDLLDWWITNCKIEVILAISWRDAAKARKMPSEDRPIRLKWQMNIGNILVSF